MKPILGLSILGAAIAVADLGLADDFETRIIGGSVQLGGQIIVSVKDKIVPPNATCEIELPAPFASHVEVVSAECSALTLQQGFEPLRDDAGYVIPSAQVSRLPTKSFSKA